MGVLLVLGIVVGGAGVAGFDYMMKATSTDEFCVSCHELAQTVGIEYEETIHAKNPSGVRVTCADCHVPKAFVPKLRRKISGIRELYHHFLGSIDTVEKFDAHRMTMATLVWDEKKSFDYSVNVISLSAKFSF